MEIVIFTMQPQLDIMMRQAIEPMLTYRQGKLFSLHPARPMSSAELLALIRPSGFYLIIVQLGEGWEWLDLCGEIQKKTKQVEFLILGRGGLDCQDAVQRHLHIVDYINQDDPELVEKLAQSLQRLSGHALPVCGGLFASREGECDIIPLEDICYIETIKRTHRCAVVCADGTGELRGNVRDLFRCLDTRFYLCRPSTIANLSKVRSIDRKERTLHFGGNIFCGYSKRRSTLLEDLLSNRLTMDKLCYIRE